MKILVKISNKEIVEFSLEFEIPPDYYTPESISSVYEEADSFADLYAEVYAEFEKEFYDYYINNFDFGNYSVVFEWDYGDDFSIVEIKK